MDTLSRLSHDSDLEVAMVMENLGYCFICKGICGYLSHFVLTILIFSMQAAIISLGFIGAGTNNARIAGMLRNLSSYYYKDASALFCVWLLPCAGNI